MLREFSMAGGKTASISLPKARDLDSIFVVAGHKTGSSLLENIINDIAVVAALPVVPVETSFWGAGFDVSVWPKEVYEFLETPGYVYHSFRLLGALPTVKAFQNGRKVFMIRDPRDVAVSYFFSVKLSHVEPEAGSARDALLRIREKTASISIDEFILSDMAGDVLRNIESFAPFLGTENSIFYRYEEVIFEKRRWVSQIARDLKVEISDDECNRIADRHDLRPMIENPNAHVRRVTPGGYTEKLSTESIRYIEETYLAFFDVMGYARST